MGRDAKTAGAEPLCRLIRFQATDGVDLHGLLYEPKRPGRRAVVFLHGTGGASVFTAKRTNLLASEFVRRGFAWVPFNNRGAGLISRLRKGDGSVPGGMANERIRECVADIDGVARFLRRRGYRELYLVGHSTGANKIAVYNHHKPRNPFRRYVFLGGGDDTGLAYDKLGAGRFRRGLAKAREMIGAGRGRELVPPRLTSPLELGPFSWISFYDLLNPDGDYNVFPFLEALRGVRLSRRGRFRHLRAVRKPSLALWGECDEFCYGDVPGCVSVVSQVVGANFELGIVAEADHGFGGREGELGSLIAEWLV